MNTKYFVLKIQFGTGKQYQATHTQKQKVACIDFGMI